MAKFEPMARHEELAGKTIYYAGLNVHYRPDGYHAWSVNPDWSEYAGTTESIHAQPLSDALAGKPFEENWEGYIDWNGGTPNRSVKLTSETEAQARKAYYARLAAEDEYHMKLSAGQV